jgi:plasmid maintenance system antidote protein VapI
MALRLKGWLGVENGGCADLWLGQQAAYDHWQARQAGAPKVQRAEPLAAQAILSPPLIPPP